MLRKHHQLMLSAVVLLDGLTTTAAFVSAYILRFRFEWLAVTPGPVDRDLYLSLLAPGVVVCLVTYRACGLYRPRRIGSMGPELWNILKATVLSLGILLALVFFLARPAAISRGVVLLFAALNPGLMFLSRATIRITLRSLRRRRRNLRWALILGAGRAGQRLAEALERNPWTGIEVIGFLDDRPERHGLRFGGREVLGPVSRLPEILEDGRVDQVYLALPPDHRQSIATAVDTLAQTAVDVKLVPEGLDLLSLRREITSLDGIPVINLRESPLSGWGALWKRGLDIAISSVVLVLLSPVLAGIALAIRLGSGSPTLFRQVRMGLDGRRFVMLKFRTMRPGSEDTGMTRRDDDRLTGLGRFLRRFSLDELPQFVNVLRGDMSIVGPRPERPVLIEEFRRTIPRYMLRHRVKSGITGWAQVCGWRGQSSLRKRIQYDLYYIQNWSLWLDLRIMGMTVARGASQKNAY